jgi:mannose-6-phosphate isomerase-like protein (cupin superfamily)
LENRHVCRKPKNTEGIILKTKFFAVAALSMAAAASAQTQPAPGGATGLAGKIKHYDASQPTRPSRGDDPGSAMYQTLIDRNAMVAPVVFMHRGRIDPKSGIAVQFHLHSEEMFFILEGGGDAQFTINGRTALLPPPAGVPSYMGTSDAIYNPGDKPLEFLNFAVGFNSKVYDGFHTGDPRIGVPLDKIPQFVNVRMDRALLRPVGNMKGGTGTVQYRRLLEPSVFGTTWSYVDHLLIPAGAKVGPFADAGMSEAYYVMKGAGTLTVNGEAQPIKEGDGFPVDLGQTYALAQNGSEPLELLVFGIAKDVATKEALIAAPRAR